MVTTFNDRIINLTKTVAPIVGKPSALLKRDPTNRNKSTSSIGMKRQVPSAFARPPHAFTKSARYTSADAKRRRVKDELHYTAATIKQALENAGRPQVSVLTCRVRALPHSVNTDSCLVISSAAYDASNADAKDSTTSASGDGANDAQDGQNSVDEMLLYSSLIQSTRSYYGLGNSSSLDTPTESINNDNVDGRRDNGNDEDDDDEEFRASSEATSTWAPSSICNNVNLNDKKTIDNDNRSDGTSSNPASSTSGEEETSDLSLSDQCEGDEASPSPTVPEKENRSDGNFLDNANIDRDDLDNVEIHNDDAAEDNDDNRRVFFVVG